MNSGAPEDYLRHEGALRALARTLVANESTAEDVVQDTWLAALRRPPAKGDNPGGWLAAAARNVARQIGRADDRRKRRELLAALPERLPAVEEVAERAALHRELVDRVLALDEPYRSALLLRYFEDLPPRAIARQLGIDVATVNQQLWRGRQRLREALDGRYGGRNAWRGFFVLALGGPKAFLPPAPPLAWLHAVPVPLAAAGFVVSVAILGARVLSLPPGEGIERGGDVTQLPSDGVEDARPPGDGRDSFDGVAPGAPVVPPVPIAPVVREHDVEHRSEAPAPAPVSAPSTAATPERETARGRESDLLAALGYAPSGDPSAPQRRGRPPGTVRVRGGRIRVGAREQETVERMQGNQPMAGYLVGETPEHVASVEPFDLMTTEVTNEQYEAFVRATGARPPYTWSASAIETERRAWFEQDNEKRRQAKERGQRTTSTEKFDAERWWNENWQGQPFAVLPEIAERPVAYVSYAEAEAYARWAGLRLPTEFELQAAVGEADYPWGKRWVEGATLVLGDETEPVGSRPHGASSDGAFDLVGSVWEWTASPYTAYEGYKTLTVKVDGRTLSPFAPFDANHRVTFGGSIHMDALAQRRTVRMPSTRDQRTNALGFRCVASATRGADLVRNELGGEPERERDPAGKLDPGSILLLERWTSEPGAVGRRLRDYAVITGYDYVALVPPQAGTETAGFLIGVLLTSVAIAEPELAPGRYVLLRVEDEARVYRLNTGRPGERDELRPASEVARLPLSTQWVDRVEPGSIAIEPGWPLDRLAIDAFVPSQGGKDGTHVRLSLGLASGTVDARWSR